MDSNTHSNRPPTRGGAGLDGQPSVPPAPGPAWPDGLAPLAADVEALATQDLDGLSDTGRVQRLLTWRQLLDRQEGLWLRELAELDARGAAGAELDQAALSTASWLRRRLRMSAGAARSAVRTARALFRGALPQTAAALIAGDISPDHAMRIVDGTQDLSEHVKLAAEPVLLEAAGRLDPPRLRQAVAHLCQVADPDGADRKADHHHERRGLWLSPTWEGMVAIDGLLEPEAGATVLAALEPLARPADADDDRKGGQRTADALTELARRSLEGGELPKAGGVRPQLLVTVDLDSLLGRPGAVGGEAGWAGPLVSETCRRLACDAAVTRVMITRQLDPTSQHHPDHGPAGDRDPAAGAPGEPAPKGGPAADQDAADQGSADDRGCRVQDQPGTNYPGIDGGLREWLRAALAWLPPVLGGAPRQPLEVGRATRVVHPAQRAALAVRDGGCVFPGCDRPLAWCDAHHLWHWVDGGPTDLSNLAMVCRAHHRTVHEGGWRLIRGPDGRFTVTPTGRRHRAVA